MDDLLPALALALSKGGFLAWLAVSVIVTGGLVRLMKSDTPLPNYACFAPKYRVWWALGLGVLNGVAAAIVAGQKPLVAILGGLSAAIAAILGHETVIESMRGGREFFAKKTPPPSTTIKQPDVKITEVPSTESPTLKRVMVAMFGVSFVPWRLLLPREARNVFACACLGSIGVFAGCTMYKPPQMQPTKGGDQAFSVQLATPERCNTLETRELIFGGMAVGFGAAGLASGLAAIPTDDPKTKTGLAISAAAAAAISAALGYEQHESGAKYVNEGCGAATVPPAK